MKYAFLLLFICFLSCTSWQPDLSLDSVVENYGNMEKMELPLEFDGGIFPYIEIFIQNKPMKLYVDLGNQTSPFILNNSQFIQIDYRRTSHKFYERNINSHFPVRKSYYKIDDIRIGDYNFTYSYASLNTNRKVGYLNNYGYIGWPLLKEFNIFFDYEEKRFVLYPRGTTAIENLQEWGIIHFSDDPLLSFPVKIDGGENEYICGMDNCLIGLGENMVFSLILFDPVDENENSNERNLIFVKEYPLYEGLYINSNGNEIEGNFIYFDIKQIKDYDLFLGGDFFFQHKVFIDNDNKILYYKRNER